MDKAFKAIICLLLISLIGCQQHVPQPHQEVTEQQALKIAQQFIYNFNQLSVSQEHMTAQRADSQDRKYWVVQYVSPAAAYGGLVITITIDADSGEVLSHEGGGTC
ncbi:MAG: PepSY domain-containing protein [Phycisphaeraceae bacterium JB051]